MNGRTYEQQLAATESQVARVARNAREGWREIEKLRAKSDALKATKSSK